MLPCRKSAHMLKTTEDCNKRRKMMKENSHAMLRSSGYGFPKVSSGLLLSGLNAGFENVSTAFRFRIFNSRLLILLLVGICAFVASAGAADSVNYDTAWTFVYDGGKLKSGGAIVDKFCDVKAFGDGTFYCTGITVDSANWKWVFLTKFDGLDSLSVTSTFFA
jgi:hypothetical protein